MPAPKIILPLVPMLLALPRVMAPLKVDAVPELLISAPPLEMPVPFNVSGSDVPKVNPLRSSTPPKDTLVPETAVPSGVFVAPPAAPSLIVPALIVVRPEYVFAPDSIHVPAPFLITDVGVDIIPEMVPELPLTPSKVKAYAPEIVPLQVSVPVVPAAVMVDADPKVIGQIRVEAAAPVLVNAPAGDAVNPVPFKVIASLYVPVKENPLRSSTAPEATVVPPAPVPRGPLAVSAEDIPRSIVPVLIFVAPV
jgi:hypothetical protein